MSQFGRPKKRLLKARRKASNEEGMERLHEAEIIYPSKDEIIETNKIVLEEIRVSETERHTVVHPSEIEKVLDKTKEMKDSSLSDSLSAEIISLRSYRFMIAACKQS